MRIILLIKILLVLCCLYFSIRIIYINGKIDKSISEKNIAFNKFRGNPALDTAENRKRYLKKKEEINKQIDSLRARKYSYLWSYIAIALGFISSLLIRNIINTLFKKEQVNRSID